MRSAIRILCRPEASAGFGLAGLPALEAATDEEGGRRLRELASEAGVGLILVDRSFYDRLDDETRRAIGRRPLPMVIPFPGPGGVEGAAAEDDTIVEILRQAIGYSVRLR